MIQATHMCGAVCQHYYQGFNEEERSINWALKYQSKLCREDVCRQFWRTCWTRETEITMCRPCKKEGERLQRVPEMIQGTVQSGKWDIERRLILLVKSQVWWSTHPLSTLQVKTSGSLELLTSSQSLFIQSLVSGSKDKVGGSQEQHPRLISGFCIYVWIHALEHSLHRPLLNMCAHTPTQQNCHEEDG